MSSIHNTRESANFTYFFTPDNTYAYFEHKEEGEFYAGGLWFDRTKTLTDYDGVFELPKEVITYLEDEGYNMAYAKDE